MIDYELTTNSATDVAAFDSSELPHAYCWPVWRFGRVLEPLGGQQLRVEAAQEIGALFESKAPAMYRYLSERKSALRLLVERSGGRLLEALPDDLVAQSAAIRALQKIWRSEESLITYSFVPIVRLPNVLVELRGDFWELRESLTVCGYPAKSKVWLTASLVAYRGMPTDKSALTRGEVDAARASLDDFISEALNTLMEYYLKVLNEDTVKLPRPLLLRFEGFDRVAETEIVGVAASVDLTEFFKLLEVQGLAHLRKVSSEGQSPGAQTIRDFLGWTDRLEDASDASSWERGNPKLLSIYADQPSCGSVRALVIPRLIPAENRIWYTVLTELKLTEDRDRLEGAIPLSESACRYTAREFGRFF